MVKKTEKLLVHVNESEIKRWKTEFQSILDNKNKQLQTAKSIMPDILPRIDIENGMTLSPNHMAIAEKMN